MQNLKVAAPAASVGRMMRVMVGAASLSMAALLVGHDVASAQQPTTPTATTPTPGRLIGRAGAELEARADGPACGPRVKVVITSTNPALFEGAIPPAAKFFTNVRAGHSLSCPQMTRMIAAGKSNGRTLFTGLADQSNQWEALILGATALDNRSEDMAVAPKGPTPKSVFRSAATFLPATDVLTRNKDKFLCAASASGGCELVMQFESTGPDQATVKSRYPLSGGRATALITTKSALRDGFFCGDPETSVVVIDNPQMSADAKKDLADQLLERVKATGEACIGFANSGGVMSTYSFNAMGLAVDKPRTVTTSATAPSFGGAK